VVRIPAYSRRREAAPTEDENRDGRIDERDRRPGVDSEPTAARDRQEHSAYRSDSGAAPAASGTSTNADPDWNNPNQGTDDLRQSADRAAADRATAQRMGGPADSPHAGVYSTDVDRTREHERVPGDAPVGTQPPIVDRTPEVDRQPPVAPAGPRPRASLLATLSLILGVGAALFVLTGTLAAYGIALGGLAAFLAVGGISATGRRHVAGKSDALIGLFLGLGAVVVGILALTGQFGWPTTDGDYVQRFREWLDAQFVNRF
jgi:hypothetical protein